MAPSPDLDALVRTAQSGDTLAMNDLLDALAPYVRRICQPIALEHADDAMQETLIVIFRQLARLREHHALLAWVRTIATREALRVARRAATEPPTGTVTDRAAAATDLSVELWDQLARMQPAERAVIVLRDLEGFDEHQVAQLLEIPAGTVKSRLHRARARFRQTWTT